MSDPRRDFYVLFSVFLFIETVVKYRYIVISIRGFCAI